MKEKKEVGFISVINVIAGIIIAIFGMLGLLVALILSKPIFFVPTFLFFAFAVFLFLPQKILRINKWLKLLISIVGFFISLIILGTLGANIPLAQLSFEEHNLNEPFTMTYNKVNFSMIIYNSSQESELIVDGKEKTTSGVFLLVNGAVTNKGNYASELSFSSVLMDNQNKTYSSFAGNLGEGLFQPELSRNFFIVFEIPKTAQGLKFLVADQTKVVKRIVLER